MELAAMLQKEGFDAWCSDISCDTTTSPANGSDNDLFGQDGMTRTSTSVATTKLALTRIKSTDSYNGLHFLNSNSFSGVCLNRKILTVVEFTHFRLSTKSFWFSSVDASYW